MAKFDPAFYPYPECREQHIWLPYDGTLDHKNKVAERIQKCMNCPTKRYQLLSLKESNKGQTIKSNYGYPTDYQVKGGLTKADKGLIRLHNFMEEIQG